MSPLPQVTYKMQLKNKLLSKQFFVANSDLHGKGLFAKSFIKADKHMGEYIGPSVARNGPHVLWVTDENGVRTARDGKNFLRYITHSTEPNAAFDGFDLFALRDIRPGEEITIDYGEEPNPEDCR